MQGGETMSFCSMKESTMSMSENCIKQLFHCDSEESHLDFAVLDDVLKKYDPNLPTEVVTITGECPLRTSFLLSLFTAYLTHASQRKEDWMKSGDELPLKQWHHIVNDSSQDEFAVWMWQEPFIVKRPDRSKVAILLAYGGKHQLIASEKTGYERLLQNVVQSLSSNVVHSVGFYRPRIMQPPFRRPFNGYDWSEMMECHVHHMPKSDEDCSTSIALRIIRCLKEREKMTYSELCGINNEFGVYMAASLPHSGIDVHLAIKEDRPVLIKDCWLIFLRSIANMVEAASCLSAPRVIMEANPFPSSDAIILRLRMTMNEIPVRHAPAQPSSEERDIIHCEAAYSLARLSHQRLCNLIDQRNSIIKIYLLLVNEVMRSLVFYMRATENMTFSVSFLNLLFKECNRALFQSHIHHLSTGQVSSHFLVEVLLGYDVIEYGSQSALLLLATAFLKLIYWRERLPLLGKPAVYTGGAQSDDHCDKEQDIDIDHDTDELHLDKQQDSSSWLEMTLHFLMKKLHDVGASNTDTLSVIYNIVDGNLIGIPVPNHLLAFAQSIKADKAEPSSLISTQQQLNEDEPIVEQPICSDYETESLETHSTKSVVLSTSESEQLKRLTEQQHPQSQTVVISMNEDMAQTDESNSQSDCESETWESVSTNSDVLSIPEELAADLNGTHETIHKAFWVPNSAKENVTLSVVTYGTKEQLSHITFIMKGYRQSVPDYMSLHQETILKITTSHPRNLQLSKLFSPEGNTLYVCVPIKNLEGLDADTLFSEGEAVDGQQDNEGTLTYKLIGSTISIREANSASREIEFSVETKNGHKLEVIGCLNEKEIPDPFSQDLKSLDELHNPEDTLELTAVVSTMRQPSGQYLSLFEFSVSQLENPSCVDSQSWKKQSLYLKNDALHNAVASYWDQHFFPELEGHVKQESSEKWKQNRCSFMITAMAPQHTPDGEISASPIQADWTSYYDRKACFFHHPNNQDFCIEIKEPASPMVSIHRPGASGVPHRSSHKLCSKSPNNPDKRMHQHIQKELQREQKTASDCLMKEHNPSQGPGSALSAMISTAKHQDVLETSVILVDGVINSCGHIWGQANDGWILSIHCLYNADLKSKVQTAWVRKIEDGSMKSLPSHARWLNFMQPQSKHILKAPDALKRNKRMTQLSANRLTIECKEGGWFTVTGPQDNKYKCQAINFRDEHDYSECIRNAASLDEMKKWVKGIITEISGSDEKRSALEARTKESSEIDEKELYLPGEDNGSETLTVCAHEVKTPLYCGAGETEIKTDTYFIMAIGDESCISFPHRFHYHDVLHSWICYSWSMESAILRARVKSYWAGLRGSSDKALQLCLKAEHMVCHKQAFSGMSVPRKQFYIEYKRGSVRFPTDKKGIGMALWVHDSNPKALMHHLEGTDAFKCWRAGLFFPLNMSDLKTDVDTNPMFSQSQQPTSAKFPTMQFGMLQFPYVGNRMGDPTHTTNPNVHSDFVASNGTESSERRPNSSNNMTKPNNASSETGENEGGQDSQEYAGARPKTTTQSLPNHGQSLQAESPRTHSLMLDDDDRAHHKFAKPGSLPAPPDLESIHTWVHKAITKP